MHVAWGTSVTQQSNVLPNSISLYLIFKISLGECPRLPLHRKKPHRFTLYKVSWVLPTFPIFVYSSLASVPLTLMLISPPLCMNLKIVTIPTKNLWYKKEWSSKVLSYLKVNWWKDWQQQGLISGSFSILNANTTLETI